MVSATHWLAANSARNSLIGWVEVDPAVIVPPLLTGHWSFVISVAETHSPVIRDKGLPLLQLAFAVSFYVRLGHIIPVPPGYYVLGPWWDIFQCCWGRWPDLQICVICTSMRNEIAQWWIDLLANIANILQYWKLHYENCFLHKRAMLTTNKMK